MTNAEKFLKEGVDVEEFAKMLHISMVSDEESAFSYKSAIKNFLNKNIVPTLTEGERAILKYIDKAFDSIRRGANGDLYIIEERLWIPFNGFNHLFQFIEPRRRI